MHGPRSPCTPRAVSLDLEGLRPELYEHADGIIKGKLSSPQLLSLTSHVDLRALGEEL